MEPNVEPASRRRVLEDATGRRLRRMRLVGRAVAVVVFLWLVVVVLGGIGVGPANRIPFGHLLRPTAGPPRLDRSVRVAQPTAAQLRPALSAPAYAARSAAARAQNSNGVGRIKAARRSAAVRGQAKAAQNAALRAARAAARRAARVGRRGRGTGHGSTNAPGHAIHTKPTKTTTTPRTKTTPSNGHAR